MQELFDRLAAAMKAGGPDSPEVKGVLQQFDQQFPVQSAAARAIVASLAKGQPAAPTATQPAATGPKVSVTSWKFILTALAVLGVGTGTGTQMNLSGIKDAIGNIPLPVVTNRWIMLAIVAALGAVVGFGYSVYRNNGVIALPSFSRKDDQFKVASLGFLRNAWMGGLVSVLTTWLAFANPSGPTSTSSAATSATPPATTKEAAGTTTPVGPANAVKTVDGPPNLLTWTILLSAVAAGVVGSRMASGEVEKNVLWEALAQSADQPALPGLGQLVDDAKTPLDAAAIATGQAVPGLKPPEAMNLVRQPAEIEADLLAQFDRPTLKEWLSRRGTPLGGDGTGVPLGTLEIVQPLKSSLKTALRDIELTRVASMTPEAFCTELDRRGIESAAFSDLLVTVRDSAIRARDLLGSLPASWTLTHDRI